MTEPETRTIPTKRAAEILGMSVRNLLYRRKKAKVKGRTVVENNRLHTYYSAEEIKLMEEAK